VVRRGGGGTSPAGLAAAFFVAGACALVAQTALFRGVSLLYRGGDLAAGLFFAAWLGWVALGAGLARLSTRRRDEPPHAATAPRARWLSTLYALTPWLALAGLYTLRAWADLPAWRALPAEVIVALTATAVAPVSLVTGALFVALADWAGTLPRSHRHGAASAGPSRGLSPASGWLFEAAGAALGGLATTAALRAGVRASTLLLVATGAQLAATALLASPRFARRALVALALASLASALPPPAASLALALDRARLGAALPGATPASYTHLRAHEDPEHLVLRLLPDNKNKYSINTTRLKPE